MQTNDRAAAIVNDLVKVHNDRIDGYDRALRETKDLDTDLKNLFEEMKRESVNQKNELSTLATRLGATPATGTNLEGKIYKAWTAVKATFSGHTRKAALENCEFGEDAAQKAYRTALADADLTEDLRQVISNQQQELKQAHDRIKQLRDQER